MENKIVPGVLTATVAIILLAVLLVPVIDDVVDSESDKYNNGGGVVSKIVGDAPHHITVSGADRTVMVDDVDLTPASSAGLLYTDKCLIIWFPTNMELYGEGITNFISINVDMDVTIENNTVVVKYGSTTYTFDYSWAYLIDPNGDYGMFRYYNSSKTFYINNIDQIKGANYLATTASWYSYEGADVTYLGDVVKADYVLNAVDGYENLYTLKAGSYGDYSFQIDNAGTPYEVHPWVIVAPLSVTGYSLVGQSLIPILSVIPILIIVSLLAGAVLFVRSRNN